MSDKKKYIRNKDSFIKKAIEIHGERYDYSKVVYMGMREKVCFDEIIKHIIELESEISGLNDLLKIHIANSAIDRQKIKNLRRQNAK